MVDSAESGVQVVPRRFLGPALLVRRPDPGPLTVPEVADALAAASEPYFDALHRADERSAVELGVGLLDAGVPARDVLLQLVAPAQARVGRLWMTTEWTIAQEHLATGIGERVVAAVGARTRTAGGQGHVVLSCVDGEWHTLAPRIVGEVLRLHDWTVTFLGASVPPAHLVSFVQQQRPDIVALSAGLTVHLPAAHRTVVAVQRTGTPVLVGGPGFGADGCWARRLGVDAWAPTADTAAELLDQRPWPEPVAGRDAPGDALAEAEYADVRRRRGRLVVAAVERLRDDPGAPARLTDSALDDDLAQMADVLAAATYVRDPRPFTEHVHWLATVAMYRGAPPAAVRAVLHAVATELSDVPFALACVDEGRELLRPVRSLGGAGA